MINILLENYFHPGITLLGICAFLFFLAWEYTSLFSTGKKIASISILFSVVTGIAAHILVLTGPRFPGSLETSLIGAIITCLAGYLLYRSLVAELPRETYASANGKPVPGKTCQQGTYALVRHPALWWYGLFLAGLFIITGSKWLIISGVVWWLANLVLVVIEDFYLYPLMFKDYLSYKQKTPMLIPNRESLSRCLKTWANKK